MFSTGLKPPGTIVVTGLSPEVTEEHLAEHFGALGMLATDRRGNTKVWVTRDEKGVPTGEAVLRYEVASSAPAAVNWFHNQEFKGTTISVVDAAVEPAPAAVPAPAPGQFADADAPAGMPPAGAGALGGPPSGTDVSGGAVAAAAGVASASAEAALARGAAKVPGGLRGGEWPCPNPACGNINFARRTECNFCKTPRPEEYGGAGRGRGRGRGGGRGRGRGGGVPAVDVTKLGPKGLFKAQDWICGACGNVNWARRQTCNQCNKARPDVVAEDRTGKGGGFNERQDASDRRVRADDSDSDEYDDFGRKKKKYRAGKQVFKAGQRKLTSVVPATKRERSRSPVRRRRDDGGSSSRRGRDYDRRSRSRSRSGGRDRDRDRNYDRRDRDRDRDYDRRDRDRDRDRDRRDRDRDRDYGRRGRDSGRDRYRGRSRSRSRSHGRRYR